jgi:hypothetical protein
MLKTVARILLLRVLPRRILPIVTVVEALLFLRGIRNRSRVPVNPPTRSRTAPPEATLGGVAPTPSAAPGRPSAIRD